MIKDTEKVPECSILEEFGLLDIDRETAKAATKAATKKLNLRETQLEIGLVINWNFLYFSTSIYDYIVYH